MRLFFICLMGTLLLCGCSPDEEEQRNESSIDRFTKKTADKAVERIKTPLEKAEAVKEIEAQRRAQLQNKAQQSE